MKAHKYWNKIFLRVNCKFLNIFFMNTNKWICKTFLYNFSCFFTKCILPLIRWLRCHYQSKTTIETCWETKSTHVLLINRSNCNINVKCHSNNVSFEDTDATYRPLSPVRWHFHFSENNTFSSEIEFFANKNCRNLVEKVWKKVTLHIC